MMDPKKLAELMYYVELAKKVMVRLIDRYVDLFKTHKWKELHPKQQTKLLAKYHLHSEERLVMSIIDRINILNVDFSQAHSWRHVLPEYQDKLKKKYGLEVKETET